MRALAGLVCVFLLVSVAAAQTDNAKKQTQPAKKAATGASAATPKPAPELKRLEFMTGDWSTEGTMQPSDFGPGGTFSTKEHNTWYSGRFFLVGNSNVTMAGMGSMKEMSVMGYDAEKKVYTYHAINSMGEAESSTGTVNGPDWTWTNDSTMKGKTYKNKFTMHEESPTSYTFKFDMSSDGGKTWKTTMEGKATKIEPAAAK